MGAINAEKESNAAKGGGDSAPEGGNAAEVGYTLETADPEAIESNTELSITKEPVGAEQYGTNIRSYSYQSPMTSAKTGMKEKK